MQIHIPSLVKSRENQFIGANGAHAVPEPQVTDPWPSP